MSDPLPFDFGCSGPSPFDVARRAASDDVMADFEALRPWGGFDLIMADPPWSFDNFSAKGEAKNAKAHYDCMPLADIMALPVSALAARDCVLWMWATNPMLPEGLACLEAWGFTFKSAGTWVKRTVHGKDAFGTGYVFRTSNEPIMIGTRGAPTVARNVRSTVASYGDAMDLRPGAGWADTVITIEAPLREHSRKPEAGFAAAEAMMPDAKRLELFSRAPRPGWSGWGNEADKFAEGAA